MVSWKWSYHELLALSLPCRLRCLAKQAFLISLGYRLSNLNHPTQMQSFKYSRCRLAMPVKITNTNQYPAGEITNNIQNPAINFLCSGFSGPDDRLPTSTFLGPIEGRLIHRIYAVSGQRTTDLFGRHSSATKPRSPWTSAKRENTSTGNRR
jgi:hypothetical protein